MATGISTTDPGGIDLAASEKSTQLAGLSRAQSALMGSDDERQRSAAIEPAGKILLSDRPTFRWSRLTGASGYTVEVYDEKFNQVTISPMVTGTSWTSPRLQRGQVFSWQVKAIKDGQEFLAPRPPAPQAKFQDCRSSQSGRYCTRHARTPFIASASWTRLRTCGTS